MSYSAKVPVHPAKEARRPRSAGKASQPSACSATQRIVEQVVQRRAGKTAEGAVSIGGVSGLPAQLRAGVEALSGLSMGDVRVHRNSAEPARLDALAFARGRDIHLGPGQERHLPHEAWHVVQQKQGRVRATAQLRGRDISDDGGLEAEADRMGEAAALGAQGRPPSPLRQAPLRDQPAQLRRLPPGAQLGSEVPTSRRGLGQVREGMTRLLSRTWAELSAAQQTQVRTQTSGTLPAWTDTADLIVRMNGWSRDQLLALANAILSANPAATLGDPALIDTGPRPATLDAANLATLVAGANLIFGTIAGGGEDASIAQVFGTANVATAKTKYANAQSQMNTLLAANKIVTDRSGYSEEVSLGGLTNSAQLALRASMIDAPNHNESVVTLIHEALHAGNADVHDFGYINSPSFTALPENVKLTNAAHFEVVPRRMRGANFDFAGQTFVPAGTTVGGVTAPALTPAEQAIRDASEMYRSAWGVALNIHSLLVRVHRAPAEWDTLDLGPVYGTAGGLHFSQALPYWSKVEMLTIHARTGIAPAGPASARPVTQIDLALSEGLVRKMIAGHYAVPPDPATAATLQTANATPAEQLAAASGPNAARDLLVRLVLRTRLGSVTGNEGRDLRAIARLSQAAGPSWSNILSARNPADFT